MWKLNDKQFKANNTDNYHFRNQCDSEPTVNPARLKPRNDAQRLEKTNKLGNINSCFYDGHPVKWLVYSGASITRLCHHASRPVSLSSWCAAACRWPLWTRSKAQHCFRLFFEWLLSVLNPFGSCFGPGKKITRFFKLRDAYKHSN